MSARAVEMPAGALLRVTDIAGGQPGDLVAFNALDTSERFSQARTRVENGATRVSAGCALWSNLAFPRIMLTVAADSYGRHDLLFKACCRYALRKRFNCDRDGCLEHLAEVLSPWGLSAIDVPDPLSLFFRVETDVSGAMRIGKHDSCPGDWVEFKAEMACLVAVSTCSVPIPGRENTAYAMEVRT